MSNKLIVFTLSNCPHCWMFKQRLNTESIPFIEIDVDKNQQVWNQVIEQTKNEYLPTFFIRKEGTDNGPVFCPVRDFNNDDEAVTIIKKYIDRN